MARKKKNYWYVLVMTNEGPKFVTEVDYHTKTAHWNELEKPLELGEVWAKDLTFGLMVNFYTAFAVCLPVEWDNQPYRYKDGHFTWTFDKEEDEESEKNDEEN